MKLYSDLLGLEAEKIEIETVEAEKVKSAMLPVGENKIKLLESTDPTGVIAKYIEKKGEGIHHLSLEVSSIRDMISILKEKGISFVDSEPRIGAGGHKYVFLHPKVTKALIELVEH